MGKNNNKVDKVYYGISVVSTVILFCAIITYLIGFISLSEKIFILFIFTFGLELGIRLCKFL